MKNALNNSSKSWLYYIRMYEKHFQDIIVYIRCYSWRLKSDQRLSEVKPNGCIYLSWSVRYEELTVGQKTRNRPCRAQGRLNRTEACCNKALVEAGSSCYFLTTVFPCHTSTMITIFYFVHKNTLIIMLTR